MAAPRPPLPLPADPTAPGPIRRLYPDRAFLTCEQVAKAMHCGRRHIATLCEEGCIQGALSISSDRSERRKNVWRIPVPVVEAWIKQRAALPG